MLPTFQSLCIKLQLLNHRCMHYVILRKQEPVKSIAKQLSDIHLICSITNHNSKRKNMLKLVLFALSTQVLHKTEGAAAAAPPPPLVGILSSAAGRSDSETVSQSLS